MMNNLILYLCANGVRIRFGELEGLVVVRLSFGKGDATVRIQKMSEYDNPHLDHVAMEVALRMVHVLNDRGISHGMTEGEICALTRSGKG